MKVFTVHAPRGDASAVDDVELVKEGFCWPALFIPVLWLLYRRQWLGLLAYALGAMAVGLVALALGGGEALELLLTLLYALVVAIHANDWRRWRLEASGAAQVGITTGRDLDEAEARWFAHWSDGTATQTVLTVPATGASRPATRLTPFATPFDPV